MRLTLNIARQEERSHSKALSLKSKLVGGACTAVAALSFDLGYTNANAACSDYTAASTGDGTYVGSGMYVNNWFSLSKGGWMTATVCDPTQFTF